MSKSLLQLVTIRCNFRLFIFKNYSTRNKTNLPIMTAIFSPSNSLKSINRRYESVENLLKLYQNQKSLPWDEIKSKIKADVKNHNSNINGVIFSSCIATKLVDVGISYYKHLLEKCVQLSLVDTYLFFCLIKNNPLEIRANKGILLKIYDNIKPHLEYQPSLFKEASQVYSYLDECWKELVELSSNFDKSCKNVATITTAAFSKNEAELGWRILDKSPDQFNQDIIKAYINYCQVKAKENKFEPLLLDQLIAFCSKNSMVIPYDHTFYEKLKNLFTFLNCHQGLYYWNIQKTKINQNAICSFCNSQLKKVFLTTEEYEMLKNNFLKDVIINNNIYIKTTESELNKFLNYLKNASTYHVVIDSLNVTFSYKVLDKLQKLILYFEKKNMKVFFIGRNHIKKHPSFIYLKNKCQYFLTDDLSDDDVFSIYAAIHGGPNTYIVTKDFLRGYADYFKDKNLKILLRKWQLLHQYRVTENIKSVIPPLIHATIPQLTKTSDDKSTLIYHLSYSNNYNLKLINPVNWLCIIGKYR